MEPTDSAHLPEDAPAIGAAGTTPFPSDGQLVREAVAGRKEAFDELIRRYQRQAMAVSYRLLNNSHDAMEVTQDAFIKGFTSLKTLEKPEAFGGWLMRIVSNLSLNYRRSRKSRSQVLSLDEDLTSGGGMREVAGGTSEWMNRPDDPLHAMESREMGQALETAMQELPEKQRLALVMFTIEKMPQKQVAEALECSVEAVKWHVFQARKKLKELLKEHL